MEKTAVLMERTNTEHALLSVSAKIADALELSQKAKELSASSELLLIAAQRELEALYLALAQQEEPPLHILPRISHHP